MSYMMYEVKCDKCGHETNTAFGIVGTTQIATPVKDCKCGGEYKRLEKEMNGKPSEESLREIKNNFIR